MLKSIIKFGIIIALFVAAFIFILVPHMMTNGHYTSSSNACINNLRQIDAAANQFALEHGLTNGAPIHFPDDLTPYIKLTKDGKIPSCPGGGIYKIAHVGEAPTCSLGTTVTPSHVLQ
jgi:hypothetical protein